MADCSDVTESVKPRAFVTTRRSASSSTVLNVSVFLIHTFNTWLDSLAYTVVPECALGTAIFRKNHRGSLSPAEEWRVRGLNMLHILTEKT